MKVFGWLAFGAILLSCGATADDSRSDGSLQSAEFNRCMQMAEGVTARLRACYQFEYTRQDGILNANYRALSTKLDKQRRRAFLESERAWLAYRDAECAYRASADRGGTLALLIHDRCVVDLTTQRATQLR